MNFKVGDKVVFKSWLEMEEEFGVSDYGHIDCIFHFTQEMEESIDKEKIYIITEIGEDGEISLEGEIPKYSYSVDMIKPYEEELRKKEYLKSFWDDRLEFNNENLHINSIRTKTFSNIFGTIFPTEKKVCMYHGDYISASPETFMEVFSNYADHLCIALVNDNTGTKENEFKKYFEKIEHEEIYLGNKLVYKVGDEFYSVMSTRLEAYEMDFLRGLITYFCEKYPEERNQFLVECILNNDYISWNECVQTEKERIRKEKEERQKLQNFVRMKELLVSSRKRVLETNVENAKERFKDAESTMLRLYEEYMKALKEKAWLLYKSGTNDIIEEFYNIILGDKDNIAQTEVVGNSFYITILQPLLFFDEKDWETSKKAYLTRADDYKYVFNAVFEREAQILFEQGVEINFERCYAKNWRPNYKIGIPQPHINGYNCWDANANHITAYLREGKYDQAYSQIKSALAGVNVNDAAVMNYFTDLFYDYNSHPCITIVETGEVMTINQANEYFKEKGGDL